MLIPSPAELKIRREVRVIFGAKVVGIDGQAFVTSVVPGLSGVAGSESGDGEADGERIPGSIERSETFGTRFSGGSRARREKMMSLSKLQHRSACCDSLHHSQRPCQDPRCNGPRCL